VETEIISYCRIKHNKVWVNDVLIAHHNETGDFFSFLGDLYKTTHLNYPKFFKMDKLCKLGFIASELLIRNTPGFSAFPKNEVALVFTNNSSSLDSDRTHISTIADKQNYFPSPSVFVYTLPNIIIGEIAIRHKLTGENAFFVREIFDEKLMFDYCSILLQNKATSAAICGWVDVDGNNADAFVYCIKKANFKGEIKEFHQPHSPQNVHQLYNS
jgi:hypothetical protein